MNTGQFRESLKENHPPPDISALLEALWYDARGNWPHAHELVDSLEDKNACWVHAYLHRKEGDPGNARYWYNRAGKQMPDTTLEKEWEEIVEAMPG